MDFKVSEVLTPTRKDLLPVVAIYGGKPFAFTIDDGILWMKIKDFPDVKIGEQRNFKKLWDITPIADGRSEFEAFDEYLTAQIKNCSVIIDTFIESRGFKKDEIHENEKNFLNILLVFLTESLEPLPFPEVDEAMNWYSGQMKGRATFEDDDYY